MAGESKRLKQVRTEAGRTFPYMGFNLLPPAVIPEIRLTEKCLVFVPAMKLVTPFEWRQVVGTRPEQFGACEIAAALVELASPSTP